MRMTTCYEFNHLVTFSYRPIRWNSVQVSPSMPTSKVSTTNTHTLSSIFYQKSTNLFICICTYARIPTLACSGGQLSQYSGINKIKKIQENLSLNKIHNINFYGS
ncbi:hypothetical protein XELAEV_18001710mg [Xenopus laevis]|nr:hypothetical protein XELAEV_18001710mg [Xenopus laevis]